jgi:hypothetical protein
MHEPVNWREVHVKFAVHDRGGSNLSRIHAESLVGRLLKLSLTFGSKWRRRSGPSRCFTPGGIPRERMEIPEPIERELNRILWGHR